jgi:glycosyltransferase involved in cell wall biosynthesis
MQRHSRLLIEQLAEDKQIEIIVLHPHKEQFFSKHSNVKEVSLQPIDPEKIYLLQCYEYSKRVYDVISAYPDAVIYSQGLSVWYNISRLSKRLIINPHGLEPYQVISAKEKLISIPFRIIFNYIFKRSAVVISLGGRLTTILQKHVAAPSRVTVIPNGVSAQEGKQPKSFDHDKLRMLFVARFAENKGIHILLKAIEELNNEGWGEKLHFDLGGKGPLFEHYSNNNKFANVNYLGFVSDEQLSSLYDTSDLFVFPTLFEGMPTVVLEAMSYGMPVIVSDVGATAELVDDSNGYLIEKNNVAALKSSIIAFYGLKKEDKQRMSATALRKIGTKYTWKSIAGEYARVFRSVADGAARS